MTIDIPTPVSTTEPTADGRDNRKLIALSALALVIGIGFWQLRDVLTLNYLAERELEFRQLQADHPWLVTAVAIAIYVVVAGLSLPGAAVLTLVCGWYFGFWRGLVIVSFASTAGATIAFLLSRYLFRNWVQKRMSTRLNSVNEAFDRDGAIYLFALRLVVGIPFFVVNAVMGLTKIRVFSFWWVSQLGMLPGTAAYVYAGSAVPTLRTLADGGLGQVISGQLLLAFTVLGFLPLLLKMLLGYLK